MHGAAGQGLQARRNVVRYLIDKSGVAKHDILHAGQSQFTDLVGGSRWD